MANHRRFNALLTEMLVGIDARERVVQALGDGVSISFLRDPEMAMAVGLRIWQAMRSGAAPAMQVGIHLGSAQSVNDMNGAPRLLGEGLHGAERVMGAAPAGEVQVSRAFHDAVAYLSDAHKKAFGFGPGYADREGRHCETFRLAAEPDDGLRAHLEALCFAAAPGAGPAHPPVATAPVLTTQQQVLKTISMWFIPFNALAAFVGLSITGLERLAPGGSLTRSAFFLSLSLAALLALLDVLKTAQWPRGYWKRQRPSMRALGSRAATVLGVVVTVMFGVGMLVLTQRARTADTQAELSPPPAAIPASGAVGKAAPAQQVSVSPAASTPKPPALVLAPPSYRPQATVPVARQPKAEPGSQPAVRREAAPVAPVEPSKTQRPSSSRDVDAERRCNEIVLRGSIGALSESDRETLRVQCR